MEGWTTLEPISFHKVAGDHQYAKDDNYMQAVLELWEKELNGVFVQTRPFLYHADDKETPLFGQVVCRRKDHVTRPVPGILLFHTAAGEWIEDVKDMSPVSAQLDCSFIDSELG